jgi:hypothetical protein
MGRLIKSRQISGMGPFANQMPPRPRKIIRGRTVIALFLKIGMTLLRLLLPEELTLFV